MKKLKKFQECSLVELKSINGGKTIAEDTLKCSSYEYTCVDNCEDREWYHYQDGEVVWHHISHSDKDCYLWQNP